jgi:hypothetical protein
VPDEYGVDWDEIDDDTFGEVMDELGVESSDDAGALFDAVFGDDVGELQEWIDSV